MEKIAWLVLTVVTLIAAIAAQRRPRALTIGRVALGIYYAFAGALVNVVYLVRGETYASFADAAHFSFVRDAWRAVVAPHYMFFIGLLVIFEATMGLLVLSGGRRAELGMIGILGMQAGLLLFGWVITAGAVLLLIAVGLLLRAQRRYDQKIDQSAPEPATPAASDAVGGSS